MSGDNKIRVLVVDDSAFMRRVIGDILSADPGIEVVGKARNGSEGLRLVQSLKPDVVTLDMEMPDKNGLEVLREIMTTHPTRVLMVSSLTKEGADVTMQALDAGAVDFVTKPSGTISLDMEKVGGELRQKVLEAGRVAVRRLGGDAFARSAPALTPAKPTMPTKKGELRKRIEMVVVAASTGGPMALQNLLPTLSGTLSVPVLIVQHMPPGFTASFAQRLDERSKIKVVEGSDGLPVRKGVAVIAPGGYHLIVERRGAELVCRLTETPPVRSVRPSADVLFASVAEVVGGNVLVVVLTGMGKDGMDGAKALRDKGAYVIAESKETCVVSGMPGSVIDAGLADDVLPIYAIGPEVERLISL